MAYATDVEAVAEEPVGSASSWPETDTDTPGNLEKPCALPAFAILAFLAGLAEAFAACFARALASIASGEHGTSVGASLLPTSRFFAGSDAFRFVNTRNR